MTTEEIQSQFEKIENLSINKRIKKHIPSRVYPDTLFNFTNKIEYMIDSLESKCFYPRFVEEDISYLKINNIKKIAIPMKCFCDINLNKIEYHTAFYGKCGIAMHKKWGETLGLQPIHYLNKNSILKKDLSESLRKIIAAPITDNNYIKELESIVYEILMFTKPYDGKMNNKRKCFEDECEWRYVPKILSKDFPMILKDEEINTDRIIEFSNALRNEESAALKYEYSDIKYIIVENNSEYIEVYNRLKDKMENENDLLLLMSKIIVWNSIKDDF